MTLDRVFQLGQICHGYFGYLGKPLTVETALRALADRMAGREDRFLRMARTLIYADSRSPYARLLKRAGCELSDLERLVARDGIEATLRGLREDGVYLTLDEFKSRVPVVRPGLSFPTQESDFDNPNLMGRAISGSTSGSRSKSVRVRYDWLLFAEEAAEELALLETHGLVGAPLDFWMPGLPSISGIHNLFVHLGFRRPPERWFSHVEGGASERLAMAFVIAVARLYGLRVPLPEPTGLDEAAVVAEWLGSRRGPRVRVLKAFTSSAVRVVRAARERGIDLSGAFFLTGGEPLTPSRRRFIEEAGIRVAPRYVATEAGFIGAGCGRGSGDEMHIYTDRIAVVPDGEGSSRPLLFSSLSDTTGKVLLNTQIGDVGDVSRHGCDCAFGRLGMDVFVSNVRSGQKITAEGMTVYVSELHDLVGALVAEAGGGPDAYQVREAQDALGVARLEIAVSAELAGADATRLVAAVYARLRQGSPGARIAAEVWSRAGTVSVVRSEPSYSAGQKLLPMVRGERASHG